MNKVLLFCLIGLFASSCNNQSNNKATQQITPTQKADSIIAVPKDTTSKTTQLKDILKNCVIDQKYVEEKNKTAKAISGASIQTMGLTSIAGINSRAETPVKIIDTLFAKGNNKVIVVSMETENESFAWIVQLINGKTTRFEQVYYADVVEYIQTVKSAVTDSTIDITTQTDIGEGKVSTATAMVNFSKLKLEKAKPVNAAKEKPDTSVTK